MGVRHAIANVSKTPAQSQTLSSMSLESLLQADRRIKQGTHPLLLIWCKTPRRLPEKGRLLVVWRSVHPNRCPPASLYIHEKRLR